MIINKTYIDMLKDIIYEEQYKRVSDGLKKEIEYNKVNIDNFKNEQT